MYFVSLRKISRVLFSYVSYTKKDRVPLCLQECIDPPPDLRQRWHKRGLLIFIIISAGLYYILNYKDSQTVPLPFTKQAEKKDLSLSDNKDSVESISHTKLMETSVRSLTKSITPADGYVKVEVENTTDTFGADFLVTDKKETMMTVNTIDKLITCTIDVEKNNTEVIMNKVESSLNLHKEYSKVKKGGYYRPDDCEPRHKVGILVPYRDRETNLVVFMFTMHPFLMKQKLEYRIFVIEQAGKEPFNRGRLFNVGFKEMSKYGDWNCVVFHDVDLIPLDGRILYTCPTFPRHMCATVVEKEELPYYKYHTLFGGVASMSIEHFKKVNGYSNMYWGWGGEDNDMFWRLRASHIPMVRYNKSVARYTSLSHPKQRENPNRYRLLHDAIERFKTDGLSDLVYKVLSTKLRHLYTHIIVDINPLKGNISNIYNTVTNSKKFQRNGNK